MTKLTFEQNAVGLYVPSAPAKKFRAFPGRNIDQMPLLLSGKNADGEQIDIKRRLATPKELVFERVHGKNEHDRDLLRNNYFHLAYMFVPDPDSNEVVLAPYSIELVKGMIDGLNPESELVSYGLKVDRDTYQAIRSDDHSHVLSGSVANELRSNSYSLVKDREAIWDHMLEGDQALRNDNLGLVQRVKGGSMEDRMGVWISDYKGARLLCVGSVGDYDSLADGNYSIDNNIGRLLGVGDGVAQANAEGGALEDTNAPQNVDLEGRMITDRLKIFINDKPYVKQGELYLPLITEG